MFYYGLSSDDLHARRSWPVEVVNGTDELNRAVAAELVAHLRAAVEAQRQLHVIVPVGPLDYAFLAHALNEARLPGESLVLVNMDEYMEDGTDRLVPLDHPLSFRRFMRDSLYARLEGRAVIPPENQIFPDPAAPAAVTRLLEEHGGADLCYAGLGLTGHLAFNDPPETAAERHAFATLPTRRITLSPVTRAQICLAGTDGIWDTIPTRAVTVGMQEILAARLLHFTLLRTWHAGLWRRAFFGPVDASFPASLAQHHPNVKVTMTQQAARIPAAHASLRV